MGEITLTVSNLSTKLTDVLYLYQQNRILCDCCIQCSDGEVYAHKIILAMWGMFGFYVDTIDTIQASKFTTADVNNFMKLIYSGESSLLKLDAAFRVAQVGKLIGIRLLCISSSLTLQESLESALSALKSSSESGVKLNKKYILYIKSLPDFQSNFSTTTNVRCREPIKSTKSMPGNSMNSIKDKRNKNLEECWLSQSSDVSSTILINENKSAESPTIDNNDDDTFEHEKTTSHTAYSDPPPEIVIEVKTENCEQPDSRNVDTEKEQEDDDEDFTMESWSGSVESLKTAKNNSVREWSVESLKTAEKNSVREWSVESLKTAENNSVRKCSVESMKTAENNSVRKCSADLKDTSQKSNLKDTGQKKAEAQEGGCKLIKCRKCLKHKRAPFIYADTTEGLENFYKHAIESHPAAYIQNVNCEICGASYKNCQAVMYMEHLVKKHGIEYDSTVYHKKTCDFDNCEYWTLCQTKFSTHKKQVHSGKRSICDVCGESVKNIRHHREIHKDRPRIPCEICGHTFVSEASVKNHIAKVHEKKYKSVGFCKYCNQNFIERYKYFNHMFREHKEIPKGMKRYQCTECDFVTYQIALLKNHKLRHKELKGLKIERNYKCHFCGKAFITNISRNYHVQQHHVSKAYLQCPYDNCTTVFQKKRSLQIHIRDIHEIGKIFQCHVCPYKCNRQGNLVKHIRTVHKEEVSTRDSRRKQAMLSGKGYHEAVGQIPRENPEDGKSSEEEGNISI
ncbi:zinc finger protein 502-like [Saccostrea echinata]|uniref:zinc finger protein 502-like n=1 Tax=Saccostrea echinata TaxID=191078 RepID=UPI002A7F7C34|nr:zinc finger protein 502-like [Saccostrea echinata]